MNLPRHLRDVVYVVPLSEIHVALVDRKPTALARGARQPHKQSPGAKSAATVFETVGESGQSPSVQPAVVTSV